jgi:hypothetical protein
MRPAPTVPPFPTPYFVVVAVERETTQWFSLRIALYGLQMAVLPRTPVLCLLCTPKYKVRKHGKTTRKHGRASMNIAPACLHNALEVICGCLAPPPRFISKWHKQIVDRDARGARPRHGDACRYRWHTTQATPARHCDDARGGGSQWASDVGTRAKPLRRRGLDKLTPRA